MPIRKNRRNVPRTDYKVLGTTGRKVFKNMGSREQILLEAKIAGDIEEFFALDELAQFDSVEEINDSIERASNL